MNIPTNLMYTKEHERVKIEGARATIGISDHAQHALGDLTFVELPKIGVKLEQFKFCATVESVKAASDVYAPLSGMVALVNEELSAHPELINKSPYEQGWLAVIDMTNQEEKSKLMSAQQYEEYLRGLK